MIKKINLYSLLLKFLILIIFTSCGYKNINTLEVDEFFINEININGEPISSYQIKNSLRMYSKENSKKIVNIDIDIKKEKIAKEKDKTGKVKQFNLVLNAKINIKNQITGKIIKFNTSKKISYNVADKHTGTLKNEKQSQKFLNKQITKEIVLKLKNIN